MAICLADATSPEMLKTVSELPEFGDLRNVIYESNIADHIMAVKPTSDPADVLIAHEALGVGLNKGNWFVDTTRNMNHQLRATHELPKYSSKDVSGFEEHQ